MENQGISPATLAQLISVRPAYKWKVQEARQSGCTCVAYVDARQVMDILDQIVGPENWQDHFREVAGKVYCDLTIRIEGDWVTKSDCGSESNFEAEKGQASDAFKRAAVKWGIGRFLYELDVIRIKDVVEAGKDNKGKTRYAPAHNGKRIWDLTEHIRKMGLDRSGQQQKQGRPQGSLSAKPQAQAEPAEQDALGEIARIAQEVGLIGAEFATWLREKHGTTYNRLTRDQARAVLKDMQRKEIEHLNTQQNAVEAYHAQGLEYEAMA